MTSSRRVFLVCFVAIGLMLGSQALGTPRNAGPDEPAHLIRAAGLVRGQMLGDEGISGSAYRVFEVPYSVTQPEPACFAFQPEVSASCAEVVHFRQTVLVESSAASYPIWSHILPGVGTLLPGEARTQWAARLLGALVPLLLLATVFARLIRTRRSVHAAVAMLALTPAAMFSMSVVNPSGTAIAGAFALMVGGLDLLKGEARAGWLFTGGIAALVLPRNDGMLWLVLAVAVVLLVAHAGPRQLWSALAPAQRTVGLVAAAASTGWAALAGTDLVPIPNALHGADLIAAVVKRTGTHLREAVGVVGWADTDMPASMLYLWWVLLGAMVMTAVLYGSRRQLAAVALAFGGFVAVPWVLESYVGRSSGLFWQGRYALPVFVAGVLALGVGDAMSPAQRRRVTPLLVVGVLAVWNLSFWQQLRRWGVGENGSLLAWEWDTRATPVPSLLVMSTFAAGSLLLGWMVQSSGSFRSARSAIPRSRLCTQDDLDSPAFLRWISTLGEPKPRPHRKQWEWAFIAEQLENAGLLEVGRKGLGFAVGREPLASGFAARGVQILASDLDTERAVEVGWVERGQHADSLAGLNERGLCEQTEFDRLVAFQVIDMTDFDAAALGEFDFVWSSCSFEHLGSLEAGHKFVVDSIACLKPGGLAVHTTEFNVGSNEATVSEGGTVIYRQRDIEALADDLRGRGHFVEVDYTRGAQPTDYHVDVPPYTHDPHLKLHLMGFTTTSIGLVIRRGPRTLPADAAARPNE